MHGPYVTRRASRKIKELQPGRDQSAVLHKHIKMGSLFEQPRNAGTLCKMRAKLAEVPQANMMQSSVARKSVVQIFEIRMV